MAVTLGMSRAWSGTVSGVDEESPRPSRRRAARLSYATIVFDKAIDRELQSYQYSAYVMHRLVTASRSVSVVAVVLFLLAAPDRCAAQTISTADGLSVGLSATADVTSVVVDGGELVTNPAPAISVRDLSAAGSVFTPNLIFNGGFETGGGGSADGWSVYLSSNTELSIVTDDAAEGVRSLFIQTSTKNNADGSAAYLSAAVAVTAGARYRLSAMMRARDGYIALNQTAPGWQRNIYDTPLNASGLYVAWFDAGAPGSPSAVDFVAPMHTNARAWKRITGEVVAPAGAVSARMVVAAKLLDAHGEDDGIWVDDASMIESPEADVPVTGAVTQIANALELTGTVAGAALDVEATYTALPDRIEVTGRVIDTSASARALQVAVRLPVDLVTYRWWDDIRNSRIVNAVDTYANWVSADVGGLLPQSLYPLAALENGTRGIAVTVPLDSPRVVLLSYHNETLEARFHVGISPAATRLNSEATFTIYIYRSDADWGLRAALDKYQTFAPNWFSSSRPVYSFDGFAQGSFLFQGGCLADCAAPCDQCCSGASLVACYDNANVASAQYTAPEGPMLVGDYALPPPSYDAVLGQLSTPPPGDGARYAALAASMVLDGNGDYFMKQMTNQSWAPNDWLANWVLNMDPEIPGGYAEWNRSVRIDGAFLATQAIGAELDGIELDNFMSAPAIDLDASRFALADNTLSYDPNTYRPGVHTMSATFEYLDWLRSHIDASYGTRPGLSANIWGVGTLNYLAPFLDFLPNESGGQGASNWGPAWLDYRRAIAYHKPIGSTYQASHPTVAMAAQFANQMLFYGGPASRGPRSTGWEPGAAEALDEARNTLVKFWHLGWEPVTRAAANDPDVWVERFGSLPTGFNDGAYFTVHRWDGLAVAYDLTIDTAAFGIDDPAMVVVKDAVSGDTMSYSTGPGTLTVSGFLEANGTDVVRLMGPGCAPAGLASASLTLRPGTNDDRASIKGTLGPTASPPDFIGSDVGFHLLDRDGEIYMAQVPAGSFVANGSGKTFRFKDRTGTLANGLTKARFSRRRDGSYRWTAKVKGVDLAGADRGYLDIGIQVGSACWADTRACGGNANGSRLRCRP